MRDDADAALPGGAAWRILIEIWRAWPFDAGGRDASATRQPFAPDNSYKATIGYMADTLDGFPGGASHREAGQRPRVLLVEDDPFLRSALNRLLAGEGYDVVTANNGREALNLVENEFPDLVLSDVMMPEIDGLELCRSLKSSAASRLIPVVLMTGLDDKEGKLRGIEAGADDFVEKPFDYSTLRARLRSLTRLKRYTDELERSETVLFALARAIEGRDPYTQGHCDRLSDLGSRLGKRLGLPGGDVAALVQAGVMHDLGKIVVSDRVLLKEGQLDEGEWEEMRKHPAEGERILRGMRSLEVVLPIIRHHHEKADGSGYPDGLAGDEIPFLARVLQVVDVYDALTTERPYRQANSPEEALAVLEEETERGWWDRSVVEGFREMILDDREEGGKSSRSVATSDTFSWTREAPTPR